MLGKQLAAAGLVVRTKTPLPPRDDAKSLTIAGGAAAGFVGVAGGVDIGVLAISVKAVTGTSSPGRAIRAADDVTVKAVSRKQLQTFALSFGAGAVGVAGSVSVWSVGEAATTTYEDSADGTDKGIWASGSVYETGDVVTHNGEKYSARQDFPVGSESTVAPDMGSPPLDHSLPVDAGPDAGPDAVVDAVADAGS